MKGKLIGIKIDDRFIPCETNCTFNYEADMLPTANKSKGAWRDYIEGFKGWSIEVQGRFIVGAVRSSFNKILERTILNRNQTFEIMFASRDGAVPEFYIQGIARVQTATLDAPVDGNATHNFQFIGCGAPTLFFDEYWRLIDAMPAESDKPKIVDTTKW